MRSYQPSQLLALLLGLGLEPALGGGIRWGNELGATAFDSQGTALDGSWTFHLGYFENGFLPSPSNSNIWATQWKNLQVSEYSPSSQLFGNVWENDGVSSGSQGFIWGLNRELPANEWILLTASDWLVPVDNPIEPDVNWFTSNADTIVVGSMSGSLLRTAVTTGEPPVLSGEDWLLLNFDEEQQSDPAVAGWSADPDLDGLTNLEEFAFGNLPLKPDSVCIQGVVKDDFFQFQCPRARAVGATYFGQVSSNLIDWDEGSPFVMLESEEPSSLVFRDVLGVSSAAPRFGRVRVELAP